MAWSAAPARALLAASPIASVEPTVIGEHITEWLKITVVPLLVFLIGAYIWGCIQNSAAWRVVTEDGGGNTRNEALGEVRSDSPRAISNNEAAEDLETGLELSQVHCRDEGRAAAASNQVLVPSLQVRPWLETLAPMPTSVGDLCVGGVSTASLRDFWSFGLSSVSMQLAPLSLVFSWPW